MSKQEATRLADEAGNEIGKADPQWEVIDAAIEMLRRWPDGEPVAWLYEARYIDTAWTVCVGLNNPGPEGAYLRGVRPLYTAQPAESERIAERKWLDNECLDGGCQSLKWRERIAALEAEKQANYEHWRNAEIDLERHRAALKVAREALEGWRSVDVHSALTEDEADAIKAKDDAALRAIEGVQHG